MIDFNEKKLSMIDFNEKNYIEKINTIIIDCS